MLRHGAGWNDAVFLVSAYRADDPGDIDVMARAFAASSERLAETVAQGAAFTEVTGAVWGGSPARAIYPVAVGTAARAQGLPVDAHTLLFAKTSRSTLPPSRT